MQQYTWGAYVWGLPNGNQLEGYQRSYDGGWVEIELLNELPLPQQTGRALDTITLSGRWFGIEARTAEEKLAAPFTYSLEIRREPEFAKPSSALCPYGSLSFSIPGSMIPIAPSVPRCRITENI